VTLLCREFHCACFYDGQMFIFGGSTGTRRMNDTWRYKLEQEPPSLQVLAAHAVLQQVRSPSILTIWSRRLCLSGTHRFSTEDDHSHCCLSRQAEAHQ
jgi:hypothetical protein